MSEIEKQAIEYIKKDREYDDILMDIKKHNYNMVNVGKLMQDIYKEDYSQYEIIKSIIYLINLLEENE